MSSYAKNKNKEKQKDPFDEAFKQNKRGSQWKKKIELVETSKVSHLKVQRRGKNQAYTQLIPLVARLTIFWNQTCVILLEEVLATLPHIVYYL